MSLTTEQQAILDEAITNGDPVVEGYDDSVHEPIFRGNTLQGFQVSPNPMRLLSLVVQSVTNTADNTDLPIEAPNNTVSVKAGTTTGFHVEIQDDSGNVLPVTQSFALPMAGLLGTSPRLIDIDFTNGAANFDISWPNSGLWEVTEAQVNMDIADPAQHFRFGGIRIKVRE